MKRKSSTITRLPVVATRAPFDKEQHHFNLLLKQFFQVLKILLVYHQFMYLGKHNQRQLTTFILELRLFVEILSMSFVLVEIKLGNLQIIVLIFTGIIINILWEQTSHFILIVMSFNFLFLCYIHLQTHNPSYCVQVQVS